jgi:hypothetical protein
LNLAAFGLICVFFTSLNSLKFLGSKQPEIFCRLDGHTERTLCAMVKTISSSWINDINSKLYKLNKELKAKLEVMF